MSDIHDLDAEYQKFLADCEKHDLLSASVSAVLEYAVGYGQQSTEFCKVCEAHQTECLCDYESGSFDDSAFVMVDTSLLAPKSSRMAYLDRSANVRLPRVETVQLERSAVNTDWAKYAACAVVGGWLGLVHILALLFLLSA